LLNWVLHYISDTKKPEIVEWKSIRVQKQEKQKVKWTDVNRWTFDALT
jgi:hypothetical protein